MYHINRPNPKDKHLDIIEFNKAFDLIEMLANCRYSQDFHITQSGKSMTVGISPSSEAGLDLSDIDFGYEITSAVEREVTISNGEFRIGASRFTVDETELTINYSPGYVYLLYPRNGTPSITSSNSIDDTVPGGSDYKHLFYTFELSSSGSLQLNRIHHLGGVFAGTYWS